MEEYIIDLQGFKLVNNNFIPKEIAIISRDGLKIQHMLLQPPFSWDELIKNFVLFKRVKWLENYHHGLSWCDGHIPYYIAGNIVRNLITATKNCIVYVKGNDKKVFMESVLKDSCAVVIDLGESGTENNIPLLRSRNNFTGKQTCFNHRNLKMGSTATRKDPTPSCALRNVFTLQSWLSQKCTNL